MGQYTVTNVPLARAKAAAAKVGYPATDEGVAEWTRDWLRDSIRGVERRVAEEALVQDDNDPDFGPSRATRETAAREAAEKKAAGKKGKKGKRNGEDED